MRTPQTRINASAMRRDAMKDDALSLAKYLATGLIFLILSAVVLQIFERVAKVAETAIVDHISTGAPYSD